MSVAFELGPASDAHLEGVHPDLVKVVRRAIELSQVDFRVFEGLRDIERQKALVLAKVSRTMDSYHLTGDAVDLVPWIGGRLQWQAPACIQIAIAMHRAALELETQLTWGAVWDRRLNELAAAQLSVEVENYVMRYRRTHLLGEHPLIDYPHFQRVRING